MWECSIEYMEKSQKVTNANVLNDLEKPWYEKTNTILFLVNKINITICMFLICVNIYR